MIFIKNNLLLVKILISFLILSIFGLYYYYQSIKTAKELIKLYLGEKEYNKEKVKSRK